MNLDLKPKKKKKISEIDFNDIQNTNDNLKNKSLIKNEGINYKNFNYL